jgi:lysyl-tRNA synthetase class 1
MKNKPGESLFWADQLADRIAERSRKEGRRPNIKCQQTPSGAKHIGNLNDVARAYFPCKSLRERGIKAEFVHTTDDRDPLKDVPMKLPDLKGKWHESRRLRNMRDYLGMPLFMIPDPFGCCASWSEHFTRVWMDGVNSLGMEPDLYSVDRLYREGRFKPFVRKVFERSGKVGEIVSKYQRTKSSDYIPFDAICPKCGRLANASSFDLKREKVGFRCGGKAIRKKRSEGCGFEGEVGWREGKLQWRFEWPALWGIFGTTYEPFGKDHAAGSWISGQEIARKIFDIEPPIPFVYEFFLVNGEKMSASVGNVYIVQDMLRIMEPEAFLYYYTKKPAKQRDLDLENIILLIDDFERAERVFFGKEKEASQRERKNLMRQYWMSMEKVPGKIPLRVPYQFASVISQVVSGKDYLDRAVRILQSTGHLGKSPSKSERGAVERRLELAGNWVREHAAEHYRIRIADKPSRKLVSSLSGSQKSALRSLGSKLSGKPLKEQELYNMFWEISKEEGITAPELFSAAYGVLIGRDSGPRLAPFILAIGQKKTAGLLKSV